MRNASLILFCLLATNMLDFLMCISIWGIWWVHTIKSRWCICPWHEIKWKERWTELERTSQDSNSGRLNRNHAMCNLKIGLFAMLYRRAYEPARLSLCRWSRTQQHVCSSSPKITCGTPLLISLHWLPVVTRIKFEVLMLVFRTATEKAPPLPQFTPRSLQAQAME